jgi:hypothetical protein
VLRVLVLPSSHITAHAVPLTTVAGFGWVTASFSVPLVGGGVVVEFETVTVRVDEPDLPVPSVTVAVSVRVPLATFVVSHENVGPVPATASPSALSA